MIKQPSLIGACALALISCTNDLSESADIEPVEVPKITFSNVTDAVGISSEPSWKYGGPMVADFDADGLTDIILTYHNQFPPELYWGAPGGTFVAGELPSIYNDVHGMAAGDYDADGDMDLMVAVGGGNGTAPRPPILMRQTDRVFEIVTDEAGIKGLGARGRSVRWADFDLDGDLDFFAANAPQLPTETGPRHFMFENLGDGTFEYRPGGAIEQIEAERILVTDFDSDGRSDLMLFTPISLWRNIGDFEFENVSDSLLPTALVETDFISAAAEVDYDNDGDFDIYLARGKTHYQLANNSISFNQETGRLDLRDEGNRGQDGLSFDASGDIALRDFYHWPRGVDIELPVFLGAERVRIGTPVEPVTITPDEAAGFPDEITENGWHLGYLGDGSWRLEWSLSAELAWGLRASVTGLDDVHLDWEAQDRNVPDILLRNDEGVFADASDGFPAASVVNSWGIAVGDYDNDGLVDFFVHRFGELRERLPDILLRNVGSGSFELVEDHGAIAGIGENSHGEMGAAFDFDLDGKLDLLNGDDDMGLWHMFRNETSDDASGHWSLVRVGPSPTSGVDAQLAVVKITTEDGIRIRRVASSGEVVSQTVTNPVHFGLGESDDITSLEVVWRDGTSAELTDLSANSLINVPERAGD